MLRLKEQDAWMNSRPDWGKGRIDPFNPVKFRTLGQPVDDTIGNSDMQPVWNLNAHAGYVVSLGRTEHEPAGSRAVVGHRRRGDNEVGGPRLQPTGATPIRARCRACAGFRTTSAR